MEIFFCFSVFCYQTLQIATILCYNIILIVSVIDYFIVFYIKYLNKKTNILCNQQTIVLIIKQLRRMIFANNLSSVDKKINDCAWFSSFVIRAKDWKMISAALSRTLSGQAVALTRSDL